ncbi:MAG TPA: sigma-70 family RNA polymerase sigma factor [Usitatibacter sp.]|nr:sigma-70 family RNA polymerase sigma factor [Usitatibacter sp.]
MGQAADASWMTAEQERRISAQIARERPRLASFVRRRVPDAADAEDILQDVFSELVEAYRLMQPIEHAGAWLFRVARNRIVDFFRKKRPESLEALHAGREDGEVLDEWLPASDGSGPEAAFVRGVLIEELEAALAELPAAQREVFIATEIEGRTFRELAAQGGENLNTLLSRKRYAVLHLRRRLRDIYEEFNETGETT